MVAAIMTLYLLITSWAAIRRHDGRIGRPEIAGLAVALVICAPELCSFSWRETVRPA
jgi:hypothetical protein